MQKKTNTQIFSGFTASDTEQINRALAIISQIPEDPHYFRPKGFEVAQQANLLRYPAICMNYTESKRSWKWQPTSYLHYH
jgi:hypothetical protein